MLQRAGQVNKTQAIKKADKLFREHIWARARCEINAGPVRCNGRYQCCHIRSRRYMAIRWSDDNALCGCAAHHLYYTHHPLEWEQLMLDRGIDYDGLRLRGLNDPPMDPFDVIERLS